MNRSATVRARNAGYNVFQEPGGTRRSASGARVSGS